MVVSHSCCHSSQSHKLLLYPTTVGKTADTGNALFLGIREFRLFPKCILLHCDFWVDVTTNILRPKDQ